MAVINVEQLMEDLKELQGYVSQCELEEYDSRWSCESGSFERGYVMGSEYAYKDTKRLLTEIINKYSGE